MRRYLYSEKYAIEATVSTIGAAVFGLILMVILFDAGNPLGWTGMDIWSQYLLVDFGLLCSTLHSIGIYLNGSSRFSPILRSVGLVGLSSISIFIALESIFSDVYSMYGITSATVIYTVFGVAVGILSLGSIADSLHEFGGRHAEHSGGIRRGK